MLEKVAVTLKVPAMERVASSGRAVVKVTVARAETSLTAAVTTAEPGSRGLTRPAVAVSLLSARTEVDWALGAPKEPRVVENTTVRSPAMSWAAMRAMTFVTVAPSAGASGADNPRDSTFDAGTRSKGMLRLRATLTVVPSRISAVTTAVPTRVPLRRVAAARPLASAATTRLVSCDEVPPTKRPRVVVKLTSR